MKWNGWNNNFQRSKKVEGFFKRARGSLVVEGHIQSEACCGIELRGPSRLKLKTRVVGSLRDAMKFEIVWIWKVATYNDRIQTIVFAHDTLKML